ncbi:glycosyltransferase [Rhodococcus sp. IEGM 1307]|jgi:glycosyltransferase involved in cell wall biosynthesis|uniref:glycosyltransferase family 2 protein n=1 Tax=Rhodococcus sp. IEGM 1307 TaxID=3047091 RepID=UPI0024B7D504|nr:glycosyltransferase [Rhodococcus sp. IEGM 1307]MDI9972631.1 glycosyltransferase [Rhodococcus sp. IEGM 1307]
MVTNSDAAHTSRREAGTESVPGRDRERPPTVSLCIPAYQAERHLQTTLDSVLAQTFTDLEVVIVDNHSSDGTRDILENVHDDRVRIIRNAATVPMVDNFNLAIRESRGRFAKLICADDTIEPDCVATQAAVLEADDGVALVSVRTDFIDDEGVLLRPARGLGGIVGHNSGQTVVRRIVRSGSNPVGPPVAGMFRRVDFDRCGGFRGELLFPMELDLWSRLVRKGDFVGVPRTLASFRIGSDSNTALTSARSQLAQQLEFTSRLIHDPEWQIPLSDRVLGRINSYDMQMRRSLLFALSALRASRRRRALGSEKGRERPG